MKQIFYASATASVDMPSNSAAAITRVPSISPGISHNPFHTSDRFFPITMVFRSSLVFLTIGLLLVHQVPAPLAGGWHDSTDEEAKAEMITLARNQLASANGGESISFEDVQLQTQVVAGRNLRLTFSYGRHNQCQLNAFQPLSGGTESIEMTSFNCQKQGHEHNSESSSDSGEETHEERHKRDLSSSSSSSASSASSTSSSSDSEE